MISLPLPSIHLPISPPHSTLHSRSAAAMWDYSSLLAAAAPAALSAWKAIPFLPPLDPPLPSPSFPSPRQNPNSEECHSHHEAFPKTPCWKDSFPLSISIVLCLCSSKELLRVSLYPKYTSDAVTGVQIPWGYAPCHIFILLRLCELHGHRNNKLLNSYLTLQTVYNTLLTYYLSS